MALDDGQYRSRRMEQLSAEEIIGVSTRACRY